jgi:endoglucanase Acf2
MSGWSALAQAQLVSVGAGRVHARPQGSDPLPPAAPHRAPSLLGPAVPTNQWYSGLMFNATPKPVYAQPLSAQAVSGGMEIAYPAKVVVPTERRDVEIHYPHQAGLTVAAAAFQAGVGKLAAVGDWSILIQQSAGDDHLRTTLAHGSPYAFFQINRGDFLLKLPHGAQVLDKASADPRVLVLRSGLRHYAAFAPTGVRWAADTPTVWRAQMPQGQHHLSVAALPDTSAPTLALMTRHAYTVIRDTRVSWAYDRTQGKVSSRFTALTQTLEGDETTPLLGLYPHQWHGNDSLPSPLGPGFDTVRGQIRLLAAPSFAVHMHYSGFVPYWPAVKASKRDDEFKDVMRTDLRNARRLMLEMGNGPYWQGKGLQRIAHLMSVVEQQGDLKERDRLLDLLKKRMESWFSGESRSTYFSLSPGLGSVLAHPQEYFSIDEMNDHHFHYGYWIRAAAEVALRDPDWASAQRYGPMVDLLVADIATAERGRSDFPFLRNFDAYEGHSWASGVSLGEFGNNQESSSEAINAWAALILWAEIKGDAALRDLGIYLYCAEARSIEYYWLDTHRLVFAPEYPHVETAMVFGGKYAHNTWWTDEPRQIKGINLLPMSTASVYLARDPEHIRRSVATLPTDTATYLSRGKSYGELPRDIWQDIFSKYLALADPAAALGLWNRWGAVEFGDTRSHTLHWLLSLEEMGTPDLSVTANTPLTTVFRHPDAGRTYLVFNTRTEPQHVTFSDGFSVLAAPRQLTRSRAPAANHPGPVLPKQTP